MSRSPSLADLGLFVLVTAIWGINFPLAKFGVADIPPMLFVGMRFVIVASILVPLVRRPRGSQWRPLIAMSFVFGCLHFGFMFSGLKGVDAGTAALAIQLQVPFASVLAALFLNDRLGWRRLLGIGASIAGVGVMAGEPRFAGQYGSLAMIIFAALVWAVSNLQAKKIGDISPWTLSGWLSLFAAPQLLTCSLLFESGQAAALQTAAWAAWGALLYNSLAVMLLSYGIWYALLKRYDLNVAMPMTLLVPVFGVASGIVILDEPVTLRLLIGGLMTLTGVAIVTLRRPRLPDPKLEGT